MFFLGEERLFFKKKRRKKIVNESRCHLARKHVRIERIVAAISFRVSRLPAYLIAQQVSLAVVATALQFESQFPTKNEYCLLTSTQRMVPFCSALCSRWPVLSCHGHPTALTCRDFASLTDHRYPHHFFELILWNGSLILPT
mgnify:CR=1 FL=1